MKKSLTELTDEELINLLNQPDDQTITFENDVIEWLSVYGIKHGDHPVTSKLLYRLYRKWSENPLSIKKFSAELSLSIPFERLFFINLPSKDIRTKIDNVIKRVDKTKNKKWWKHFNQFLEKYEIKKGGLAIKGIVLYNIYDKWCYDNNRKNHLSLTAFLKFCKLCFTAKKINYQLWFYIDRNIKQYLTPELIELMRKK